MSEEKIPNESENTVTVKYTWSIPKKEYVSGKGNGSFKRLKR